MHPDQVGYQDGSRMTFEFSGTRRGAVGYSELITQVLANGIRGEVEALVT